MSNYIANSKNRKLKKQILLFLERINFGAGKLPFSGRVILFMNFLLLVSLLFPWFSFRYRNDQVESFSAFSEYTWYLWYGVVLVIIAILFFLVSHAKKEQIRAHIPFRLSDAQAVVFSTSLLLVALAHLLVISKVFNQFALEVMLWKGFLMAASSSICIIISAYFFSKNSKEQGADIRYFGHHEDSIWEYRTILEGKWKSGEEDTNMTLPI